MKKILLLMLLNAAFACIADAQNFEWAKRAGLWAYDYGYGITTDSSGNIYVAGKYEMNANFSGTVVPCQGNHDIYVAKYSPSGALSWVRTAGGHTGDYATCVATDNSYVYIGGEIEGAGAKITFVGSAITLYSHGSNDIVIAKYDVSGNLIWARRAGDIYYEKALGIACDNSGNVYVCGLYNTTATFGGTTTISGYGENDIFLAKYDASGNFLWVRKAGGTGRDEAKSIAVDDAGNVYICGMFKNTADFNGTPVNSNGYFDMFLAKYSTDGNFQWVKKAGAAWDDVGWSLTLDNAGKIFVTGEFNASVNFGGIQLTTVGSADIFVARYNSSGNIEWAKRAGGNLDDRARGIGSDGNNIFITGQFSNTATFGNYTTTAADSSDIFFTALSNDGNFLWTSTVNGAADPFEDLGYESGNAICAEANGNVYATGSILNGGVFGSTTLNPYERTDIFIVKLLNDSTNQGSGGTDTLVSDTTGTDTSSTELISAGSPWKYLDNGSNQGTAWKEISFNDSAWKTGNAELGYGDGDETTVVSFGPNSSEKYITTYFRKTFDIQDASAITGLELGLIRDDGAVVYINGVEVNRNNMPSGIINYNTLAPTSATATESVYQVANISASSLVNGINIIAVEMHQATLNSSDLSFNLKLSVSSSAVDSGSSPAELIAANSSWKYFDNGFNQDSTWKNPSYSDLSWKTGNAEFGYGDGDETTVVSYGSSSSNKYITTYFRKTFNVIEVSTITGLELNMIRDDGAVVYINGVEVTRNNMPLGIINYNTLALNSSTASETVYQVANIGSSSLVNGTNLIAVEIHQHSANSSDISFNLKLRTISGAKMAGTLAENHTTIVSFTGKEKTNHAYLSWVTSPEINNHYFIIERSIDEENFHRAGIVMGAGNSANEISYLFIDSAFSNPETNKSRQVYYRLNLTDYDGIATYSPAINLNIEPLSEQSETGKTISLNIYPNPLRRSFTFYFSGIPARDITLYIYDMAGEIIYETKILNEQSNIDVSSFTQGIYLVGVKSRDELIFSEKIIVQK